MSVVWLKSALLMITGIILSTHTCLMVQKLYAADGDIVSRRFKPTLSGIRSTLLLLQRLLVRLNSRVCGFET